MNDEILDHDENFDVEEEAIDVFFKAYLIFFSVCLGLSFLVSTFPAGSGFVGMFFSALAIAVFAFPVLYVVLLIVKKKGLGRILINVVHFFLVTTIGMGLIFHFARWPSRSEMLAAGLVSIPFFILVQLIYELVVRKDISKFLNIISAIGIGVLSFGILFSRQSWPYGSKILALGALLTVVMTIVHLLLVIKKEARYQIHVRYLAQCVFAIVSAIMLLP